MDLIGEEEKKALLELVEGGYVYRYGDSNDPRFQKRVYSLERDFEAYLGVKHAVAVNSGTSALITALWALGIGPGDEVIVPGYTFIASISSIVFARAIPVLAEVDETLTLDPEDVAEKITPRTKAVMLVHMLGNPGHVEEIRSLTEERDLFLVEDCAQAAGAKYRGKPVGTFGHVGAFSFNVYKTITGGDGGMVVTDDDELYRRAFAIHDQGHLPLRQGVEQGARTVMGLNFRMTEFTGAVVGVQLKKLDAITSKLRENKRLLMETVGDVEGLRFREVLDPGGEVGSILTLLMPDPASARRLAALLGTMTVAQSGWHVYSNMEHFLGKKTVTREGCPFTCPYYEGPEPEYRAGMLPKTDDLLARAVNVSVGVSDAGLGAGFGVTIKSAPEEVVETGRRLRAAVLDALRG